jgi:hypothetical protein
MAGAGPTRTYGNMPLQRQSTTQHRTTPERTQVELPTSNKGDGGGRAPPTTGDGATLHKRATHRVHDKTRLDYPDERRRAWIGHLEVHTHSDPALRKGYTGHGANAPR